MKSLVNKINERLHQKPLIYFSREVERSLGLEEILENFKICTIESHYISDVLKQNLGNNLYCAQKEDFGFNYKSTLELLKSEKTIEWIKKATLGKSFYAQFFQFNSPAIIKINEQGGEVINNNPELNRKIEGKINQYTLLKQNGISVPEGEIANLSEKNYLELIQKYSSGFIVQLDFAHTGIGTFFIESEADWNNLLKKYNGNIAKITRKIEGHAYTLNAVIYNKKVYVNGIQFQITGVPSLTSMKGTTVGNDWSFGYKIEEETKKKIYGTTKNIGEIMISQGFRGLFGIDLMLDANNQIYVIEVNARQTANIPMQTKLEVKSGVVPLLLLHIAEFLGIYENVNLPENFTELAGSQIFLRAKKDEIKTNLEIKGGIYRLQSDNSAIDWDTLKTKENVLFIDEDRNKPLIWTKEGYSVSNIIENEGFILYSCKENQVKNLSEELARMQFTNQIVYNNEVSPWILEALKEIEHKIIF